MRNSLFLSVAILLFLSAYSQKPKILPVKPYKPTVILYEHANYTGAFKTLGPGQYVLSDFNDVASSIRVPAGMVAYIYEHAAATQGYGISVDFLEDVPDLSVYGFNDKTSYISVFYATKDNQYEWKRNAIVNGQFVPGHWERKSARPGPPNAIAVVSSPIPSPQPTTPSVLAVNGSATTIKNLGIQTQEGKNLWERAMRNQLGIIGNDFRGTEEIGSACFERAASHVAVPNFINFWYPQKQSRDNRSIVYFKRTLTGTVTKSRQVYLEGSSYDIRKAFEDFDVNIDIRPDPAYQYLITDGHKPEHTEIMKSQYYGSLGYSGSGDCPSAFDIVEAEITDKYHPPTGYKSKLVELNESRIGEKICVYGPWIWDEGHCCHPEIHPAEQLWWSKSEANFKKFNLNVVCDASRRFWWRSQMDDGTKLKPSAEPPIKGLFAIAFEYSLPNAAATASIGYNTLKFEADYIQHYNLAEYPNANQTYNLVYNGKNIVSFVPNNNAFKVSFEHVGISPEDNNKIRGFLVLETSVGKTTQIATQAYYPGSNPPQLVKLPAGSDPSQAPQALEKMFFKKEEGHYYFTVTQSIVRTGTPVIGSVSDNQ